VIDNWYGLRPEPPRQLPETTGIAPLRTVQGSTSRAISNAVETMFGGGAGALHSFLRSPMCLGSATRRT